MCRERWLREPTKECFPAADGLADVNLLRLLNSTSLPFSSAGRHGRGQGSRDVHHENGRCASSNEGVTPRFTYRMFYTQCSTTLFAHAQTPRLLLDSHSIPCLHPVHPSLTPGLSHRPHRQQQARTHGAHEVRLLSAE
jgi:hypothetical protein